MLAVNSIAEVIRERTSIKKGFIDKEISREQILSLLEDAVWAPTHGVREPWRLSLYRENGEKRLSKKCLHVLNLQSMKAPAPSLGKCRFF